MQYFTQRSASLQQALDKLEGKPANGVYSFTYLHDELTKLGKASVSASLISFYTLFDLSHLKATTREEAMEKDAMGDPKEWALRLREGTT